MKTLREKIAQRMEDRGISTPQLARKLDCHQQTIYKYIWGESSINSDLLEEMLKVLGFEVK